MKLFKIFEKKKPKYTYDVIYVKAFCYKNRNKHGVLNPYSGVFDTIEEAEKWYRLKGVKNEEWFGRYLVLCEVKRKKFVKREL